VKWFIFAGAAAVAAVVGYRYGFAAGRGLGNIEGFQRGYSRAKSE
jgi:hypothetical protein